MPLKLHCDNLSCEFNRKRSCICEDEVVINNEGLCMNASDFTDLSLDREESETD